jgi:hypothetical protein
VRFYSQVDLAAKKVLLAFSSRRSSGGGGAEAQRTEVIVANSEKSIELLNKSMTDERAAIHQYMYFHIHLDDLGFSEAVQARRVEDD